MPETMSKVLFVRVDAKTHAILVRAAKSAGMGLAEWSREVIIRAAERRNKGGRKAARRTP